MNEAARSAESLGKAVDLLARAVDSLVQTAAFTRLSAGSAVAAAVFAFLALRAARRVEDRLR